MKTEQIELQKSIAFPWILSSLVWFLLVVGLGGLLRIFFAFKISLFVNFEYTKHAHSHTAFWGWAGPALFGFLLGFGMDESKRKPIYEEILFWSVQILTALAFPSFFFKGYSALSIVFSSFFVLTWFGFVVYYFRTRNTSFLDGLLVGKIFQMGLVFLVLSTVPTFFLPISIFLGWGKETIKTLSIHFFLETYGEGWLYLFSLGILLFLSEFRGKVVSLKEHLFLGVIFFSILLCSFRSTLDLLPTMFQNWILISSFVWGLIQIAFSFHFLNRKLEIELKFLWLFVLLKGVLDTILIIPGMDSYVKIKSFGILYLHLKLLGVTSFVLFLFINKFIIPEGRSKQLNSLGLLAGILFTFLALLLIALSEFSLPFSNLVVWNLGQGLAVIGAGIVLVFALVLMAGLVKQIGRT